jgi:hypothetical protein
MEPRVLDRIALGIDPAHDALHAAERDAVQRLLEVGLRGDDVKRN